MAWQGLLNQRQLNPGQDDSHQHSFLFHGLDHVSVDHGRRERNVGPGAYSQPLSFESLLVAEIQRQAISRHKIEKRD